MIRNIEVSYETEDQFVELYLSLFYKQSDLTPQEYELLVKIVKSYNELRGKVPEPYLTELIFSTDRKKAIQTELNISDSGLSNLLKSLKDKGVFGSKKESLLEYFYPINKVTFTFINKNQIQKPVKIESISQEFTEVKKGVNELVLEEEIIEEPLLEAENSEPVTFDGSEFDSKNFIKNTVKIN